MHLKFSHDLLKCLFFLSYHTPEVMSPATVTVSESGPTSVRVSWGPLQPDTVTSYYIEYSALPRGKLHAVTVNRMQNSTLLRDLQPDTTYLVTVSARHASGKERAMSVKVCTQEGEMWEEKLVTHCYQGSFYHRLILILHCVVLPSS